MTVKKKGLGKGMAALMEPSAPERKVPEELTDEQISGNAVAHVAMTINRALADLSINHAERMLRMIIGMCNSELKSGWRG